MVSRWHYFSKADIPSSESALELGKADILSSENDLKLDNSESVLVHLS